MGNINTLQWVAIDLVRKIAFAKYENSLASGFGKKRHLPVRRELDRAQAGPRGLQKHIS